MSWMVALLTACCTSAQADEKAGAEEAANPIRVLIITGGHDFERAPFFAMFDSMPGVVWSEMQHPAANDSYSTSAAQTYDVIVLYDMVQNISEKQRNELVDLLKNQGKGLVALHHSLANYQSWPEFRSIIGGRYYFEEITENGVTHPKSTYEHDQRFRVRIADPEDSVTKGMGDFDIEDETYAGFAVEPGVNELLQVEHPKSAPVIGWSKTYGKARVVYLQLGHGPTAYENENFRTLVLNSIRWVSQR